MSRPNFLIIGAAKSGTTALHYYLGQHPDIFMTRKKEPKFFTFEGEEATLDGPVDAAGQKRYDDIRQGSICNIEAYHDLFTDVTHETALGESSPLYLYCPRSAQRIYDYNPEMKLIAILRNPVERAFSHYLQYSIQVQGDEYLPTFEKAIAAEPIESANIWNGLRHYVRMGFYFAQLERYVKRFDPHQMRIY
ncbi:MAG: sulfotransferase, partial [Merismopedia sp. SIO2A8]|nr:sulfotransferase [Merismopedia sp. SIO2A8]